MNVEADALWFLLVGTTIVGGAGLLLKRLDQIERTLEAHGRKLVRIETRLNVPDDIT